MKRLFKFTFMLMLAATTLVACDKDEDPVEGERDSFGESDVTGGNNNESSDSKKDHEYVDLGLPSGTLWATCNVGANTPGEYGDYFAWGETKPKSAYYWTNLKYCLDEAGSKFSKYVTDSAHGEVDGKDELDLSDDAAYVNWGPGWRMPSKAQQEELREKCEWIEDTVGGHHGYKVVGQNGNFIFLPTADCRTGRDFKINDSFGEYWSRSLSTTYSIDDCAYFLHIAPAGTYSWRIYRYYGQSVRPVKAP